MASQARDTVHIYIQARDDLDYSDPEFEQKILADPLMIEELEKQQQDLKEVECARDLAPDSLDRLRKSSSALGLQPVARGLINLKNS